MARSYKKNPICSDHSNGAKYWKKIGNKKVRKINDFLSKGNKYKKIYNSWEIHDYISRWDKNQALDDYYNRVIFINGKCVKVFDEYRNENDFLNKYWKKYYFRK